MFTKWEEKEWNKFYQFMVMAIQTYLHHGIITFNHDNELKKLRRMTGSDFIDFMNDQKLEGDIAKAYLYNEFLNEYPNMKFLNHRKFNIWVKEYCVVQGISFKENKVNSGQRHWYFEN